jgi:hypothetical protein
MSKNFGQTAQISIRLSAGKFLGAGQGIHDLGAGTAPSAPESKRAISE